MPPAAGIDEVLDDLDGVGVLEVEGDRFLASVDAEEVGRDAVDVGSGAAVALVGVDVFDLVDVSTEVGEESSSRRGRRGPR